MFEAEIREIFEVAHAANPDTPPLMTLSAVVSLLAPGQATPEQEQTFAPFEGQPFRLSESE